MKLEFILVKLFFLHQSSAASILSTAREAVGFGTLVAAVEKAGLANTLSGPGNFTVFAPTDSAFDSLLMELGVTAEVLLERSDLGDILSLHVVVGFISSGNLRSGMALQSLQGGQLTVAIDSNTVKVRDAKVTTADLSCSNGVIHVIDKVLLPAERLALAGGSKGWNANEWSVVVDGVMGGRSSGSVVFEDTAMVFAGNINLNGGGFSSVRTALSRDLTGYAGFWVEVGTTPVDRAPLVLELQLEDGTGGDFSAPIALPLATSPSRVKAFVPMSSFTYTRWSGEVQNGRQLDPSSVRRLNLYVLYQSGPFEARIMEISAVKSALDAPDIPTVPAVQGLDMDAAVKLLQNTIDSGGLLYDKGYPSLCAEMYASSARTLLSSENVPATARGVACAGLSLQVASTSAKAWALRRAFDAIIADASGQPRRSESLYISEVQGQWLPNVGAPSIAAAASCSFTQSSGSPSSGSLVPSVDMESPADDSLLSKRFYGPFVGMGITDNNDFGVVTVGSPLECARLCIARSECRSFDYGARSTTIGQCWLSKADRSSASNKYEVWQAYDYYELKPAETTASPTALATAKGEESNGEIPSSSTRVVAIAADENDGDIPTWVFIALGVSAFIVILLAGVIAMLLFKRSKSRKVEANQNVQIVVGKPVGGSVAGGATTGVVALAA